MIGHLKKRVLEAAGASTKRKTKEGGDVPLGRTLIMVIYPDCLLFKLKRKSLPISLITSYFDIIDPVLLLMINLMINLALVE